MPRGRSEEKLGLRTWTTCRPARHRSERATLIPCGQRSAQHHQSTATLHELHELLGLTRFQAPVARGQDHSRAIERKRHRLCYDGNVQVVRQLERAANRTRHVEVVDRSPGEQGLDRDAIHRTIGRHPAEPILRRTSIVSASARSRVKAAARFFPLSPSFFLKAESESTFPYRHPCRPPSS